MLWQQLAKHSIQAINYHDLSLDNSSADRCAFLTFYSRNAKGWDLYCDTAYHCADFKTLTHPLPTEQLLVSAVTQAKWLNILSVSFSSPLDQWYAQLVVVAKVFCLCGFYFLVSFGWGRWHYFLKLNFLLQMSANYNF